MEFASLQKQFGRMGARVTVNPRRTGFAVDIGHDRRGSLFDIAVDGLVTQVSALDVQPMSRHLLLVVRRGETHKYLCGHDERDWFAAAVPDSGGVANVREDVQQPLVDPRHVKRAEIAKRDAAIAGRAAEFDAGPGLVVRHHDRVRFFDHRRPRAHRRSEDSRRQRLQRLVQSAWRR